MIMIKIKKQKAIIKIITTIMIKQKELIIIIITTIMIKTTTVMANIKTKTNNK